MGQEMIGPAQTLAELEPRLSGAPLLTDEEFEAFYRGEKEIQSVRGRDVVRHMKIGLESKDGTGTYKAFLMGRSGVGKSTEITRLLRETRDSYVGIRFSVRTDLDPKNFTPFDVVLLMMVLLAEETKRITEREPDSHLMRSLLEWYAERTDTLSTEVRAAIEAAAGADARNTWWNRVVGAFVSLKGELSYTSQRKAEVVEYKLTRIRPLIDTANALLRNCGQLLYEHSKRYWLFVGEEFDKSGIPSEKAIDLFLVHGSAIFHELNANLIFNLPLALAFGPRATELPNLVRHTIFDTPVYDQAKNPNVAGLQFVRNIIEARANFGLFEDGQLDRLIVGAGGNLRDLFAMIREAGIVARVEGASKVGPNHVKEVLNGWRAQFQGRLGNTQFDANPVETSMKIGRLKTLYERRDLTAEVGDNVLSLLLQANAVQEFNTEHWFGVHPLIVEVLKRFGDVPNNAAGGAP